jgi:hypothetical protein
MLISAFIDLFVSEMTPSHQAPLSSSTEAETPGGSGQTTAEYPYGSIGGCVE